ncbi:helix-turn-helix domain-containing protein [Phaeobacter sp. 11ANDIMAR09]|uniref:helix-turn-helix domain-containing protein n=1 Tax=Phaeobacter sp. 11ANDIMAR09 TaxID=1225647 RepID=UPI0006C85C98|nr:helix-turn-helix transcriptional regulator [Phaeobacter sp. 11ANDIMAR09]KPD11522.1 XRE family transcriptional regulator [Phaeobacter sp. 11ANDIMAR09]
MNLRVRVGLNLQNTRYSRKLSQEALALSAGIDRSYISEIELAKSSVSLDILERLARALDVDPQVLLAPREKK